jgi:hypothetical protein
MNRRAEQILQAPFEERTVACGEATLSQQDKNTRIKMFLW